MDPIQRSDVDADRDSARLGRRSPPPPLPPRAWRSPRSWAVLLGVFIAALALDLATKHLAFTRLCTNYDELSRDLILNDVSHSWRPQQFEPFVVIPKVLSLQVVVNRGAVFGIGPGRRGFFIGFTIVAIAAGMFVFAFRTREGDTIVQAALAAILAGAGGNLYDRIAYASVRDFLNLLPEVHLPFGLQWPRGGPEVFPWVFNVADVMLLIGIGLLLLRMGRTEPVKASAEASSAQAKTLASPADDGLTASDQRLGF